jgi:hypothetical protein
VSYIYDYAALYDSSYDLYTGFPNEQVIRDHNYVSQEICNLAAKIAYTWRAAGYPIVAVSAKQIDLWSRWPRERVTVNGTTVRIKAVNTKFDRKMSNFYQTTITTEIRT